MASANGPSRSRPRKRPKASRVGIPRSICPHFDSPGAQQYLIYRLADSLLAERRGEWEAFMAIEDNLEKQRKLESYLPPLKQQRTLVAQIQNEFTETTALKQTLSVRLTALDHLPAALLREAFAGRL